jgi:hypothetical protein
MPLNYPRDDCHKQAVIHIRESRQFEFAEGGSGHGALNGLRWSEGGGESSWAHRSGAREGRCGDGRKTGGDSGGTLLKGAAGRQQPGGWVWWRGCHATRGAWLRLVGDCSGGTAMAGSVRAWGREMLACVGRLGKKNGVGRARMNSDDFQLFKPISNELEWF